MTLYLKDVSFFLRPIEDESHYRRLRRHMFRKSYSFRNVDWRCLILANEDFDVTQEAEGQMVYHFGLEVLFGYEDVHRKSLDELDGFDLPALIAFYRHVVQKVVCPFAAVIVGGEGESGSLITPMLHVLALINANQLTEMQKWVSTSTSFFETYVDNSNQLYEDSGQLIFRSWSDWR